MAEQKRINWIPALVLNCVLLPFSMAASVAAVASPEASLVASLISIPILVPTVVFTCILHYRCWAAVPKEVARTTPGKAVGFLFIPFFNFYWAFVSYQGLAEDLHKAKGGANYSGLGVALAILFICACTLGWIPIVGIPVEIAGFILWVVYTRGVVKQAAQENAGVQPA